jgi:hypothetical protein
MSTKINVRSPFYLNLSAPATPAREFTCATAFPRGLDDSGFAVDNQGVITDPTPDYGFFESLTSTDSDFSNNKFATETSDTSRSVTARIRIPAGFSNADDVYKDCVLTAIQPATSTCTGGPTTSGSISAVSLDDGGDSTTIDLSSYFTSETTYAVNNPNPSLVTTAIAGSNLVISSNAIGGSTTIYAIGRDASYPTTCQAVQAISVTVTLAAPAAFTCNTSPLTGGGIAQDGTITRPSTIGTILGVATSDGGTLLSPETVSANTGSSAQNVTLYFRIQAPTGYSNAGATLSPDCSVTYPQPGVSTPDFSCDIAGLTGQTIAKNGSVYKGSAAEGTIVDWSPKSFDPVTTNTSRVVSFTVQIPSGYTNAGSNLSPACDVTIIQPADVSDCGLYEFFLTPVSKDDVGDFCDDVYGTSKPVLSTASTITGQLGAQICFGGNAFDGKGRYWGILQSYVYSAVGLGPDKFYAVKISSSGIVQEVKLHTCDTGGSGTGSTLV